MRRHSNGRGITLACFCLLAYIFVVYAHADNLLVNLTECSGGALQINISDQTENGTALLSYESVKGIEFHSSCPKDHFRLNESSSELILNSDLTAYCIDVLECRIQCTKVGSSHFIRININRTGHYTMKFKEPVYNASTLELTPPTQLLTLADQLVLSNCSEVSPSDAQFFSINQSSKPLWFTTRESLTAGSIYSTSLVDYEQLNDTNEVILTIRGQRTLGPGGPTLEAFTHVNIAINDADDMNPVFDADIHYLNISEGTHEISGKPYTTDPPIHAYDGDRGLNTSIIYSIEGNMASIVGINNVSGEIYIRKVLDADEGHDLYVIIIKATQENNSLRTATSTLSLSVIDMDDHQPVFESNHYSCSVTEHSAVGQEICKVTAKDKDKGQNANFTYQLVDANTAVYIKPDSGIITVNDTNMLDREKENTIHLKVITKTVNGSIGSSTANVTINLIDINDNSPEFNNTSPEFDVSINTIGGYIGKLDAYDLDEGDNKLLNFSIDTCLSNTDRCSLDGSKCRFPFQIDPSSGNITLSESSGSCKYSALVSVCDSPHSSMRRCSKTLLNIQLESNMTNIVNRTSAIPENAPNNSQVAEIPEQCSGFKSIVCDKGEENVFLVDIERRMVVTNGYLDYENTSSYNCSVVCGSTLTVIYNITVLDVNDNAPTFLKDPYVFEILNLGSESIGNVSAEDKDENKKQAVTFEIQESLDVDLFLLNSTSGVLKARDVKSLSRDYYHLTIVATDSGKPPLKSLVTVLISKFSYIDNQLTLRTKFSEDEINSNKAELERNISRILKVDITIKTTEQESTRELQGNKIYISATRNGSALSFEDLLRLVTRHYDPLMSYLLENRGEAQSNRGNSGDSGLTTPIIALITIACVVFVGTIIAIVVIHKQHQGHQRYKRLYENLTRNNSLYESEASKVVLKDETSDYNGSLSSRDIEASDPSKTEALVSARNPMYGLDSTASVSVEEAILSLNEISDQLIKEENVPKPDYEHVSSENVQTNAPKSDYENLPLANEYQEQSDMRELISTESPLTFADINNDVQVVLSSAPDHDQHDGNNDMMNGDIEPNDINSEQSSEIAPNPLNADSEINNENFQNEPLPDYNKKQVRFAHQVLDAEENKMAPLKQGVDGGDGDPEEKSDDTLENKTGEYSGKHVVPPLDLSRVASDASKLNVSDESGWLEEEINSPVDVVTIDDKDNECLEEEVTSF